MNFREFLKRNNVILDGGMGTLLQERGLAVGELPERWNISHPDEVKAIHRAYYNAGANVVSTNTFGANSLKFSHEELEDIIASAVRLAKAARSESVSEKEKFIALDIGPSGKLLKPLGDLDFEDAVGLFAEVVSLGVSHGVDLIIIETMNDSYETKAALLAAKENSTLPVIVTNAYGKDGKLMTGADAYAMAALLEGLGADAIGANCSLGPTELIPVAKALCESAGVPVVMKPNAGLPEIVGGKAVFSVGKDEFASVMGELYDVGVSVFGGCCGTVPEHISALCSVIDGKEHRPVSKKERTVVSSYTHSVVFDRSPVLIGERINPTGKKRFKEALISKDIDYILGEALKQEEAGAEVLDVNVGLPEINEAELLVKCVEKIQSVTDLPLQIDSSDPVAMEAAVRRYNGKPMINSVNGKRESMEKVFPIAKKYGGVIIALTLDENGIPETAEGRLLIAERILKCAEEYGISKADIVFDPLTLTVSADKDAAKTTLKALRLIKERLGCKTSLGVSNVSFGLPMRDVINSSFFTLAIYEGLGAAIMNPYSADMMRSYYSARAILGIDESFRDYIGIADRLVGAPVLQKKAEEGSSTGSADSLSMAIERGLSERAAALTDELLKTAEALDIVNGEIIPALNKVGVGYENKTVYLPALLMSAEAAKAAFGRIKLATATESCAKRKTSVVIATVEGDIHDIGKNIVKLILENYGFSVTDLGRDVKCDRIVESVLDSHASLVGLSALMTTTAPAMEKTVRELKKKAPWCKIMVGGAVITEEYAEKIGADHYAPDAMDAVRYAESVEAEH